MNTTEVNIWSPGVFPWCSSLMAFADEDLLGLAETNTNPPITEGGLQVPNWVSNQKEVAR